MSSKKQVESKKITEYIKKKDSGEFDEDMKKVYKKIDESAKKSAKLKKKGKSSESDSSSKSDSSEKSKKSKKKSATEKSKKKKSSSDKGSKKSKKSKKKSSTEKSKKKKSSSDDSSEKSKKKSSTEKSKKKKSSSESESSSDDSNKTKKKSSPKNSKKKISNSDNSSKKSENKVVPKKVKLKNEKKIDFGNDDSSSDSSSESESSSSEDDKKSKKSKLVVNNYEKDDFKVIFNIDDEEDKLEEIDKIKLAREKVKKILKKQSEKEIKTSDDTAEIYCVFNNKNSRRYIGAAFSFTKGYIYGAKGRVGQHVRKTKRENKDCPALYKDMETLSDAKWYFRRIVIVPKDDLKHWEEMFTVACKTYLPKYGYNYFMGDKKPYSGPNREKYEKRKFKSNVNRAKDGAMRQSKETKDLPQNVGIMKSKTGQFTGYRAIIKIPGRNNDKPFTRSFGKLQEYSKEQLLEFAVAQIKEYKKTIDDPDYVPKKIKY